MMVTLTNHVIARAGSTLREPLAFGDFCDIFLPDIGKGQKKILPFEHGAPADTVLASGKSGPGFCITFIKRLNEGLR